jgi:hypothetical protein
MADDDSLQDSRRGVPGNIQILQEDTTVATVASQGSAAIFQQRARCTLLEIEQDEVIVRKGDRGLPGSKIYVANWITATQSLLSKFLGSFHPSEMVLGPILWGINYHIFMPVRLDEISNLIVDTRLKFVHVYKKKIGTVYTNFF